MARNFGIIHLKPIQIPAVMLFKTRDSDPDVVMIPARTVGQPANKDGVPWKDICGEEGPDRWFISVDPANGWIFCAEKDPTMLGPYDVEFWMIDHPGPDTAIRAHKWNGEKVVDYEREST